MRCRPGMGCVQLTLGCTPPRTRLPVFVQRGGRRRQKWGGIYLRKIRQLAFRRNVVAGARRFTLASTSVTLGVLNSLGLRLRARSASVLNQPAISASLQPRLLQLSISRRLGTPKASRDPRALQLEFVGATSRRARSPERRASA